MLDDILYHVVAGLLNVNVWGGDLIDGEGLPGRGPAVYVANHAGSLGPIAVICSLPFRVYPWVIGDMLDRQKAPGYLERDFVQPGLHLHPPLSRLVSRGIAHVSVRLLCGVKCVPVWHGEQLLETYRISVNDLEAGRPLLIFPEDPAGPADEICGMRPFRKGFAHLGEIYFERTRGMLRFYPLAVHARLRQVQVGRPLAFNPNNERGRERARISAILESAIRSMLIEMEIHSYAGIPLPH